MIKVTRGQYKYAAALSGGAMTTRDLANHFCVTTAFAVKVMAALRRGGVIKTDRQGRMHRHELIVSIDDVVGVGSRASERHPVHSEAEIEYVAELRNRDMTGQRLTTEFRKRYPDRGHKVILSNIVPKAVDRGLCR